MERPGHFSVVPSFHFHIALHRQRCVDAIDAQAGAAGHIQVKDWTP